MILLIDNCQQKRLKFLNYRFNFFFFLIAETFAGLELRRNGREHDSDGKQ